MNDFLEPFTLPSGIQLKNRLALAPMTNKQSHADGQLGVDEWLWLQRRAQGGFGSIITCASHVMKSGQGFEGQLGIFDDSLLPGLNHLASMLHKEEAAGWVQLYHGGVRSPMALTGQTPISASAHGEAREATEDEIEAVIAAFVLAALRARKAGFTGVEIHGAHGYLLDQFLDTKINQRRDRWGGTLENRARLSLSILQGIRAAVPDSFVVGLRLSTDDPGLLELAQMIDAAGADYLHISLGDFRAKADRLEKLGKMQRRMPLMAAGSLVTPEDCARARDMGADLLALGRIAIAHADWPKRAADPAFEPDREPYAESRLAAEGVGPVFIQYMKRWKGFVV